MCGVTEAIIASVISTVVSVIGSVTNGVMQANAQNEQARRQQAAAQEDAREKMKALAARDMQTSNQNAQEMDQRQRQALKADSAATLSAEEGGIGGETVDRVKASFRRQELEGVQAADRNLQLMRAQNLRQAGGVQAGYHNNVNSIQWANPGVVGASTALQGASQITGSLLTPIGGGNVAAQALF